MRTLYGACGALIGVLNVVGRDLMLDIVPVNHVSAMNVMRMNSK